MNYYVKKGAPANKLNLGIGTYGCSFTLQSSSNNGVGAPISGPGKRGPYLEADGELAYNEVREAMLYTLNFNSIRCLLLTKLHIVFTNIY